VSPEDITKCEERFMKARTVASIMRHVASRLPTFDPDATDAPSDAKKDQVKEGSGGGGDGAATDEIIPPAGQSEEERLEKLYEQVAWQLGRKYGNVYDAFKLALTHVVLDFSLFTCLIPFTLFFPFIGVENPMQSLQRFPILCHKQHMTSSWLPLRVA
jgi:translation initiation factor 2 subunit 1